jgi:hypothetical protein
MRALVNGEEGGALTLFKGADASLNLMLLNDDGTIPANLSSDTIALEFYADARRSAAAVFSKAAVVGTLAAGLYTVSPTAADMNFGPGTYYAFAKRTQDETGTPVTVSKKYVTVTIS